MSIGIALRGFAACLALGIASVSQAQFNIKLAAEREQAPSSSFGAAPDQRGYWNSFLNPPAGAHLKDVRGHPSNVTVTMTNFMGFGVAGASTFQTGDYARLLNTGLQIGTIAQGGYTTITFNNIGGRVHDVYTYAAYCAWPGSYTTIYIGQSQDFGSQLPIQTVTSLVYGDDFRWRKSHALQRIRLVNGERSFTITVFRPAGPTDGLALVNGIQIVPVSGEGGTAPIPGDNGRGFNIDAMATVPSDAFRGAADQPGYWNRLSDPSPLHDRSGRPTRVTITKTPGGGGSGGFWDSRYTQEYLQLMGDHIYISNSTFTISNLAPGIYDIYTYGKAGSNNDATRQLTVNVPRAVRDQVQVLAGAIVPNVFAYHITHTIHRIFVAPGQHPPVSITVSGNSNSDRIFGFQIAPVDEAQRPGSMGTEITALYLGEST